MSLFTTKVQLLKKKSGDAISIFQKTVSKLADVNKQIDVETEKRQYQIDVLKAEQVELDAVASENSKFINKLNEFLGIE